MKQGRSLTELAAEIERQAAAKVDFIAPTTEMHAAVEEGRPIIRLGKHEVEVPAAQTFGLTAHAHGQLSDVTGVPKRYYDRMMAEQPALWSQSVNTWLHASRDSRMVRTLDGNVRAVLSKSYRRLDNRDLAEAVLPVLIGMQDVDVVSCEVTDRSFYLKVTRRTVQGEVKKGDIVQLGMQIRNSEVGSGAVEATPLVLRLMCMNGATVNDWAHRGIHLGRSQDSENLRQLMSGEALRAEDRAFFLKMRDVVREVLAGSVWEQMLDTLRQAAGQRVEGRPDAVVERLAKEHGLGEDTQASVLRALIDGGDLTRWGVVNAVTATANGQEDYEEATRLERLGGTLLTLPRPAWQALQAA